MNTKQNKKVLAIGGSVLAVAVVATALMGMMPNGGGNGEPEQTAQKTVVEIQSPSVGSIVVTGSYVGTVEPGQQVTVYPKASGEVTEANFSVGDTVEAGDVLFRIDSTSLQLDIAQTQASLSTSQARAQLQLESAQQDLENYTYNADSGLNSTLLQAEAAVRTAENTLQQANVTYRDARQAYNDYVNGDSEDEDYSDSRKDSLRNARIQAELKVESAQLGLENAKASLEAAQKSVEEQKDTVQNSVKSAEISTDFSADYISLQKMQNNLSDYTVTSPISGVVEQRNLDPYDMASTQYVAYVISNKDSITVSFSVTESALSYMRPGDSITLEKNGATYSATVSEVSTMADSASGLYKVKASVQNAPFDLPSGSTIKLYANTQKVENELIIPIDAVYYDNGTPYVYLFEDNAARRVNIETGISDAENIHVKSGLSLSDEFIITWSASLYDGAEVYLPGTVPQDSDLEPNEKSDSTDADDAADSETADADASDAAGDLSTNDTADAADSDSEGGDSTTFDTAEEEAA